MKICNHLEAAFKTLTGELCVMHVAVLLKFVSQAGVPLAGVAPKSEGGFVASRLDEHALEEALRLKETHMASRVTVVTAGMPSLATEEGLRRSLGMGADHAIHVVSNVFPSSATESASLLTPTLKKMKPDLIFCGAMSDDLMQGMTGPSVAACLGLPFATQAVSEVVVHKEKGSITVVCDAGGGIRQELCLPLPALVSVQQGFNTPRYPNISRLLKAREMAIETLSAPSFSKTLSPISLAPPPPRGEGVRLEGDLEEMARGCLEFMGRHRPG